MDYCTPLTPITITNHNYIKILESDWSSAGLISAVIVQLHMAEKSPGNEVGKGEVLGFTCM